MKIRCNYTVDEAALVCGVAKVTVRRWIKSGGLQTLSDKKPALILGPDLADFLVAKFRRRRKLEPHEFYCFKCRAPRSPALGLLDYIAATATRGNLRALCAECTTVMNKAVSASVVAGLRESFEVTIVEAERHLMDISQASLDDHLPLAVEDVGGAAPNPQDHMPEQTTHPDVTRRDEEPF